MSLKSFLRQIRFKKRKKYFKRKIVNIDNSVSVICSNCWGGFLYHDLGLQFKTPTINLTFSQEDFLFFCENLKLVKTGRLYEDKNNDLYYPVGILFFPDLNHRIKIHFVHYKSFSDAKKSFLKRTKRINFNNVVFLFNVVNLTNNIAERFKTLKADKKICVYINYDNSYPLVSNNNCLFFKLNSKIPKNRDMLSFKTALGRKMYIDDIDFNFHKYIFNKVDQ